MSNKYWKGGGTNTNWNSSPVTNWSNTDGGPGNQTAPATGDSVFFTATSSAGGASVWNTAISLATLDCTGAANAISGTAAITISSGNLVLPTGVGATYSHTGVFTFTGTSGTQQITSHGFNVGGLTFNGVGGTFQLQDNLSLITNGVITLTNGIFDAQAFTINLGKLDANNANTKVIKGSGVWTFLGAGVSGLNVIINVTGTTVTNWTSPLTFTATTATTRSITFGAATYSNAITIAANSSLGLFKLDLVAATYGSLTITGPNAVAVKSGNTLTLTGALLATGTSSTPILFETSAPGSSATISAASGTFSWCGFRDFALTGSTGTATNSFDYGNNAGVTITAPSAGGGGLRLAGHGGLAS